LSEKQPVEIRLNFIIKYRDSQNCRKETVIPLKKKNINGCDTDERNPRKIVPALTISWILLEFSLGCDN
jgi:hypothetical protein